MNSAPALRTGAGCGIIRREKGRPVMMDNDADTQRLEIHLRITRIIVGAMVMGIVSFLGIVIFLGQQGAPNPKDQGILSALAAAVFAIMFVLWRTLPNVVVKNQVQ